MKWLLSALILIAGCKASPSTPLAESKAFNQDKLRIQLEASELPAAMKQAEAVGLSSNPNTFRPELDDSQNASIAYEAAYYDFKTRVLLHSAILRKKSTSRISYPYTQPKS